MLVYPQIVGEPEGKSKFQRIHDRYLGLMLHVARQVLGGNEWDAGNTVQKDFCVIAKDASKIFHPACIKTRNYIVTIVENKAIGIYRAKRRVPRGLGAGGIYGVENL